MIEIRPTDYAYVAANLAAAIEGKEFFSGTICTEHDDFYSTLIATLIIYHNHPHSDSHLPPEAPRVVDIVAVWWEFHTYDSEGEEILNDFSFADVKPLLICGDEVD